MSEGATTDSQGIVVITGTSRGFGLALAGEFAARGTRVVGVGRSTVEHVVPGIVYVTGDIRERSTIESIVTAVGADAVDVVINNAAIGGKERDLGRSAVAEMRAAIEVNALAHVELLVALGEALARSRRPLVINVTSRMGSLAFTRTMPDDMRPASLAYSVSKATLDMLTMRLGRSAFGGAHVVGLDPGPMQTGMGRPEAERSAETAARSLVDSLQMIRQAPPGETVDLLSISA